MKKLFLILILSTLLFPAKAQLSLDSFYRKGATWCEYSWHGTGFGNIIYFQAVLYTGNDTLINGLNYHSLWCDNGYVVNPKLIGGLRVDTSKVYFHKLDTLDGPGFAHFHKSIWDMLPWHTDTLLYDFNLQIGDSLEWKSGANKKVIEIDSVQATNGVFVKRFYFGKDTSYPEYWLRGPGSNLGLYMPGIMYPVRNISYHYDDMVVFNPNPNNYAYVCFPTAIQQINSTRDELVLYPNPMAGDELQVKSPADIALLSITDISGRIKYSGKKLSRGNHSLHVFLEPGIYFINIQFEDGTKTNRKLVKQ
ncbi:T9SS type A sorting domain-containing protein [Polluticoccus soli]|uniref:T9SS type A sorting domain-containing protein n=1 Tax=Polluticoccus soli TaxID=3034150 RepID=UPI0023E2C347|nr:T9SS type A sorting domain-containing protein [Flavipsychrobacter sp. JY13-12]